MRNFAVAAITFLLFGVASSSPRNFTDIRHIDFKNFSFPWDEEMADGVPSQWRWISKEPQSHFRASNGIHHFFSPGQDQYERERAPLISVDSVTYGDLDGDGEEEAAVRLNYSSGGTANWDFLYLYTLHNGQPKLMALLESGSRADGGLVHVVIANHRLVLDFADSERRAGDCCSEGFIRVHYRWRNGAFVEEGPHEKGDLPLQEH